MSRDTFEDFVEEYMETVRSSIDSHGWHATGVMPSATEPGFMYTTGLTEIGLPELVVYGLPFQFAHPILQLAIAELRASGAPADGQSTDKIANMRTVFRHLPTEAAAEYLTMTGRFYGGVRSAVQVVWPDTEGLYPWDAGCNARMADIQSQITTFKPPRAN